MAYTNGQSLKLAVLSLLCLVIRTSLCAKLFATQRTPDPNCSCIPERNQCQEKSLYYEPSFLYEASKCPSGYSLCCFQKMEETGSENYYETDETFRHKRMINPLDFEDVFYDYYNDDEEYELENAHLIFEGDVTYINKMSTPSEVSTTIPNPGKMLTDGILKPTEVMSIDILKTKEVEPDSISKPDPIPKPEDNIPDPIPKPEDVIPDPIPKPEDAILDQIPKPEDVIPDSIPKSEVMPIDILKAKQVEPVSIPKPDVLVVPSDVYKQDTIISAPISIPETDNPNYIKDIIPLPSPKHEENSHVRNPNMSIVESIMKRKQKVLVLPSHLSLDEDSEKSFGANQNSSAIDGLLAITSTESKHTDVPLNLTPFLHTKEKNLTLNSSTGLSKQNESTSAVNNVGTGIHEESTTDSIVHRPIINTSNIITSSPSSKKSIHNMIVETSLPSANNLNIASVIAMKGFTQTKTTTVSFLLSETISQNLQHGSTVLNPTIETTFTISRLHSEVNKGMIDASTYIEKKPTSTMAYIQEELGNSVGNLIYQAKHSTISNKIDFEAGSGGSLKPLEINSNNLEFVTDFNGTHKDFDFHDDGLKVLETPRLDSYSTSITFTVFHTSSADKNSSITPTSIIYSSAYSLVSATTEKPSEKSTIIISDTVKHFLSYCPQDLESCSSDASIVSAPTDDVVQSEEIIKSELSMDSYAIPHDNNESDIATVGTQSFFQYFLGSFSGYTRASSDASQPSFEDSNRDNKIINISSNSYSKLNGSDKSFSFSNGNLTSPSFERETIKMLGGKNFPLHETISSISKSPELNNPSETSKNNSETSFKKCIKSQRDCSSKLEISNNSNGKPDISTASPIVREVLENPTANDLQESREVTTITNRFVENEIIATVATYDDSIMNSEVNATPIYNGFDTPVVEETTMSLLQHILNRLSSITSLNTENNKQSLKTNNESINNNFISTQNDPILNSGSSSTVIEELTSTIPDTTILDNTRPGFQNDSNDNGNETNSLDSSATKYMRTLAPIHIIRQNNFTFPPSSDENKETSKEESRSSESIFSWVLRIF